MQDLVKEHGSLCSWTATLAPRSRTLLTSLGSRVGGVPDRPTMRPDPFMDLVTLVAIMVGVIVLFVLLWLLARKYSVAPVAEPPRGDETLADGASSHRRASKASQQRLPVGAGADAPRGASSAPERGLPDAAQKPPIATGRTAPLAPSSGPDVVAASVPKQAGNAAAGERRPESSAPDSLDHSVVQNKPKASSGWVFTVTGDNVPDQPSRTRSVEDANAAATGTGKHSSYEEEPDTAGIGGTSGSQAADQTAREESSGMASAELTATKEHRRHRKKSKKQQREGSGAGSGVASAGAGSPPEVGADADTTTTTRRKHKSRRRKDSKPFTSAADGILSSGLSTPQERSQPSTLVPKSPMGTRRSSTKSKTSRKSGMNEDAKSDAAAYPPAGWTIGQAPADDLVVAAAKPPATAETADAHMADAQIADDDFFLPELPDLGGKELEPSGLCTPNRTSTLGSSSSRPRAPR